MVDIDHVVPICCLWPMSPGMIPVRMVDLRKYHEIVITVASAKGRRRSRSTDLRDRVLLISIFFVARLAGVIVQSS